MKRITNKKANKKGFTLTELILVIAIIVIMVGAVSVGIVIDLNRYNEYLDSLTDEDGNSVWERGALNAVRGIFGPGPVLPNVTLAPTPIPTAEATASASASATAAASASAKPTTTAPTSAPPTTPPTAPPTTPPTNPPSTGGNITGSTSVSQHGGWGSGGQIGFKLPDSLKNTNNPVTIVVEFPGDRIDSVNGWNWQDLGGTTSVSGNTVTLVLPKVKDTTDIGLSVSGSKIADPKIVSVNVG